MRRAWQPNFQGPSPYPTFLAWCPEPQRYEAFTSTLIALVGEAGVCEVFDFDDDDSDFFLPPIQAAERIRSNYEKYRRQRALINDFVVPSGRTLHFCVEVNMDQPPGLFDDGGAVLYIGFGSKGFNEGILLPDKLTRFKRRLSSFAMDAGVAWFMGSHDSFDILKRFCTAHPAITTGCCIEGPAWSAPLTAAATYHADGDPRRDLALSWIYQRDKKPLHMDAGLSLDVLRERVESSPRGSSVWILDEDRLSREQILAALDLPPKTLVEALATAANMLHPKWDAIQWELNDHIKRLLDAPEDEKEMIPVTQEHIQFIEDYTPAYARHLENGALVLHAHPDRTLWPLWSDALRLLGIRA